MQTASGILIASMTARLATGLTLMSGCCGSEHLPTIYKRRRPLMWLESFFVLQVMPGGGEAQ